MPCYLNSMECDLRVAHKSRLQFSNHLRLIWVAMKKLRLTNVSRKCKTTNEISDEFFDGWVSSLQFIAYPIVFLIQTPIFKRTLSPRKYTLGCRVNERRPNEVPTKHRFLAFDQWCITKLSITIWGIDLYKMDKKNWFLFKWATTMYDYLKYMFFVLLCVNSGYLKWGVASSFDLRSWMSKIVP